MRRDLRKLQTIRPRTTASLRHKTRGDHILGCEVFLAPQVPHRISPCRGAPVSPAVGNGMFTRCGNRPPVLWSTEVHFFCSGASPATPWFLKRGRTGPTAGETGPRCGRTCGATRRQRSDDSPLISNHALKKGGRRQMLWFWRRAADWRGPVTRANLFLNRRRATGPHARADQVWSDGRGAGRFAAHFSSAPRDSHRLRSRFSSCS